MDRRHRHTFYPSLQHAAECGNINKLYGLIDDDPFLLENIDSVPFFHTPLHIAAAYGKIEFAVEIMNLKPSYATKPNIDGYTPLHLAVENDHHDFVYQMIKLDHSLARVKGKNGFTPFLSLVSKGNEKLVAQCLEWCPECIEDVSGNGSTALHIAVLFDQFETLRVLIGWIQRMKQRDAYSWEGKILNQKDISNNTALHHAAYKNDHQAARLLLECRFVRHNEVNGAGLTFLDVLRTHGQSTPNLEKAIKKYKCKVAASLPTSKEKSDLLKSPFTFGQYCITFLYRIMYRTPDEAREVSDCMYFDDYNYLDCPPACRRCTPIRRYKRGFCRDES